MVNWDAMNVRRSHFRFLFALLFFFMPFFASIVVHADTENQPLALIYKGPGSCSLDQGDAGASGYGCSEASADVVTAAGFRYSYVGPNDSPSFADASVWIQPGGVAVTAYFAMAPALRQQIVNFVSGGGGYVGFCAGAYLATSRIGQTRYSGFGIFPGSTAPYSYSVFRNDVEYGLLSVLWNGIKRILYFEGGPYLYGQGQNAEIIARFNDGLAAAGRATYGKGRVYISGPHPEAPEVWTREDGIANPDGSSLDIATDMIRWTAGL